MAVSNAAKAAAIMHFVSDGGEEGLTPERAVEMFDELGRTHCPVNEILDRYDCARWGVYGLWPEDEYWESIEMLALTIDSMHDHFEFPLKEL